MKTYTKLLNVVKYVGGSILAVGTMMFLYGFSVSNSLLTGLGLGAAVGAIFIFIMGLFFVLTEEMIDKTEKGILVVPKEARAKIIPFKLK